MRSPVVIAALTLALAWPQEVKFSANTQLVVEIVNAKDKSGKPIEGLTAKDFVVTENGVPQRVSFCEFQKLEEEPLPEFKPQPLVAASVAPAQPAVAPVTQTQISPEQPGDI